ncbi:MULTISPECIES: XdhC family protein [unclassified Streptomyces]|uniref:XdhC family protein n=1 Tax=unclassified Streptomyces TaxID=2593676 RepID=UPI000889BC10|nr:MULTISPECIES: XdhC/CoxI family protein [unclassified Streptomyces]PBC85814.1 xanthine dehydrogenase accessory factor [Streptomyces sp. 2321.6]SDR05265.1 xanthine dehydrogenase accessory factor [Streptomyces sp. KS_16]SED79859.1 xanthine dehydrogenase accessory factor [Streptomyces sp. 2133.1]SED96085.1 xanthine dehydrogenase accessory factor [Streptomyces sp. 2112.3]SNC72692.1 xanthine dehydrogenase accessory factor [Streptomyces sp. 2114.4]
MLDIAEELHRWVGQGRDFAVATVVATHGSAPRRPGAALAVDSDGTAIGSVSGGCVEGAVYELCQDALRTGEPVLESFGYSDEDAFAVGLTCGGIIDILVQPVRTGGRPAGGQAPGEPADDTARTLAAGLAAAATGEAAALARIIEGPAELRGRALLVRPDGSHTGTLGGHPALDRTATALTRALLDAGRTTTIEIGAGPAPEDDARGEGAAQPAGEQCGTPVHLLVESSVPAPRMIVFGAIDFAAALVKVGKFLNYHVTVCDARPVFATRTRFPDADEIVVDWPHRYLDSQDLDARTVLCVLTHDAKFDVPLLERALKLPVAYVGAMGSRRTHLDRLQRLRDTGLTELELNRLRSPIGLDLGARTPEETALSIAAEIVANRRGGTGVPLTGAHTPIHHDTARPVGRIGSVA